MNDFPLQPNTNVKLELGYSGASWSLGLFDIYRSRYHDNIIRNPARGEVNPPSRSYHRLSQNASYGPPRYPNLTLGIYLDNLLDEKVYLPELPDANISNTLPSLSGRSVMVCLGLKF